jgi:flagellar motility protein MotE (MotC chaperone)
MASSSTGTHGGSGRLQQLYEMKFVKLKEQKDVSDKMHELSGILQESTQKARKNLQAAIAVSKQPGYFEYYAAPSAVEEIEKDKTLAKLARVVQRLNRELDEINSEIASIETAQREVRSKEGISSGPSSLAQWFDVYGRAKSLEADHSMRTTFQPSPKVYGGTSHHRAFKSLASSMKKGKATK